jgi:hypothetical protein
MSEEIYFHVDEPHRHTAIYSSDRASLFQLVSFTHAVSRAFGKKRAITGRHGNGIEVVMPTFCELVEEVFRRPQALTFHWAQIAASFYEIIQNEVSVWEWPVDQLPNALQRWIAQAHLQIRPLYYASSDIRETLYSSANQSGKRHTQSFPSEEEPKVVFRGQASGKILGKLSTQTARMFYELTVGLTFLVELPVDCVKFTGIDCVVSEEPFSRLVERIASQPLGLYFQWVRLAIALYDQIHDVHPSWMCKTDSMDALMTDAVSSFPGVFTMEPIWLDTGRYIPVDEYVILPSPDTPTNYHYVLEPDE